MYNMMILKKIYIEVVCSTLFFFFFWVCKKVANEQLFVSTFEEKRTSIMDVFGGNCCGFSERQECYL